MSETARIYFGTTSVKDDGSQQLWIWINSVICMTLGNTPDGPFINSKIEPCQIAKAGYPGFKVASMEWGPTIREAEARLREHLVDELAAYQEELD